MNSLHLSSLAETESLAQRIAAQCKPGDVITLNGQLGVGKTTFARSFIHYFNNSEQEIVSPTFSLIQIYCTSGVEIWHLDLYRLKSMEEALELGIEDGLGRAIMLIEWPEVIAPLLPRERLDITLEYGKAEGERTATLRGPKKWQEV